MPDGRGRTSGAAPPWAFAESACSLEGRQKQNTDDGHRTLRFSDAEGRQRQQTDDGHRTRSLVDADWRAEIMGQHQVHAARDARE